GSDGWPGSSYGTDNDVPKSGSTMPAFGDSLTPEDLLAVVRYEREVLSGEVIGDIEGEVLGAEDELLITTPEGEVGALLHYFGEEAEAGTYTIVDDLPFINGAQHSAP